MQVKYNRKDIAAIMEVSQPTLRKKMKAIEVMYKDGFVAEYFPVCEKCYLNEKNLQFVKDVLTYVQDDKTYKQVVWFLKNKCCTTCRIFNWDHLMMFSPIIFMGGFYAVSLVTLALLAWLVWELCIMIYPERFWDRSNAALKCSECTDKLCTQYCRKLQK